MTNVKALVREPRLLAGTPLFAACPPALCDALASRLIERFYADGDTIFLRDDPGDSVMIVATGRVAVRLTSPQGREILLAILSERDLLGEMSLLDGRGRSADAIALGPCRLLVLERVEVLRLLRQSPETCLKLMELLTERLRRTSEQLEAVALFSLPARLARLLLDLSGSQLGRSGSNRPALPPALSQRNLGLLVGASRSKVNVQLSRWITEGILRRERGGLVLHASPCRPAREGCQFTPGCRACARRSALVPMSGHPGGARRTARVM
ncbi:Crp/Fnr family transcriptional regulator [Inquilinus sp.]|uniref:Crp/Fnr family transcriptional regulator n=1 Tax=Inquilinus sp. TaxID=1932117 RepID=UPI0031D15EA2